ncbi:hypothetical protein HPB51_027074 [Rhipicephalus microplus]|uniref:Uncharacterized protein n=1 Tax=Rhipicephalus microplus TaxID=6941 RepID=A0A9J6D1H2_RHIMP|nr:hypothetical protein HPB51_027074 [Rhipicephalus microplus]
MPEVEIVEGEEISHEEANRPGWTTALGRNKKARVETPVSTGNASHGGSKGGRRTAAPQGAMKRLAAASRLPRLPRDHIRIIVKPRDGLDVRKVSQIRLAQAIAMAAALAPAETEGEIVCPNIAQNIAFFFSGVETTRNAYATIQQIRISEECTMWRHMSRPPITPVKEPYEEWTLTSARPSSKRLSSTSEI